MPTRITSFYCKGEDSDWPSNQAPRYFRLDRHDATSDEQKCIDELRDRVASLESRVAQHEAVIMSARVGVAPPGLSMESSEEDEKPCDENACTAAQPH